MPSVEFQYRFEACLILKSIQIHELLSVLEVVSSFQAIQAYK